MRSPRVTWFDWVMRGYLVLGLALMGLGLLDIPDGNPDLMWPFFLLGGIAVFQAGLFLVWRMLIRPAIAAGVKIGPGGQSQPAEPGLFRGVFLPAGAILAVLAIAWLDAAYTESNYLGGSDILARQTVGVWQDVILIVALLGVPISLAGLGMWHAWGPRTMRADGKAQVAFPFAARGWLWAVAGLAVAALLVPWFCLEVVSNAEIVVPVKQAYHDSADARQGGSDGGLVSLVARADELRSIASMPGSFRYAHRGIEIPPAAAACILIAFTAVLASFIGIQYKPFGIMLGICCAVALLLIVGLLHTTLDNPQWLTVDHRTETGLADYLTKIHGEHPHSVAPLLPVLRKGFTSQPALGIFLALAAGGLGFFIAITELCWGPAAASVPATATASAKPQPLDPVREALRRRVVGPAIGLMIAGVIGILPFLIGLLVIPAAIISEPQLSEPQMSVQKTGAMTRHIAAGTIACLTPTRCLAPHGAPAALTLPLLLAQQMPPQPRMDVMPTFAVLLPLMALFYLFNLALSITLIVAGWRMRQLKSYGLSMVGAIMAMLPCSFGWIVGLPMGIWAFSVLQQPDVRQAFQS